MTDRYRFLTFHVVTPLPYHNRNRDELGLPKHFSQGGSTRAMLSSQSIKRAARTRFEAGTSPAFRATRSRLLAAQAVARAKERAEAEGAEFDEQRALLVADLSVFQLASASKQVEERQKRLRKNPDIAAETAGDAAEAEQSEAADTNVIISDEELRVLVDLTYAAGTQPDAGDDPAAKDVLLDAAGTSSSLAIAAFGRMLAATPTHSVDAAVSVGPAVTTHAAVIETDYFSALDDLAGRAAHLGASHYTSGVYYRTFTIDRDQLRRNWRHLDHEDAHRELARLIRELIIALPSGKSTSTGADSLPTLVVAQEQAHRVTLDFQDAVTQSDESGFLAPTLDAVRSKLQAIDAFQPGLVGGQRAYASPEYAETFPGDDSVHGLVEFAAEWARA
ncbi:MAG: type I-E CRISPR-associated protein Cas7/Cse4/CasC [Microbacteriaceae bacterium]